MRTNLIRYRSGSRDWLPTRIFAHRFEPQRRDERRGEGRILCNAIAEIARKLRRIWRAASASSPREERVGRGPRRGAIQNKRASSPRPSPPSDGGEGVSLVAAPPRCVHRAFAV